MSHLISDNLEMIRALCRDYGVLRLDVFGSATTDAFDTGTSDVDFVVTFANTRTPGYADRYLGLAESLESLLGRPVDLVVDRSIRNHYFREAVEATRQPVYDETDSQTAA